MLSCPEPVSPVAAEAGPHTGDQIPRRPADLVDRDLVRYELDTLWVTDVTEQPTQEGKVTCAVVSACIWPVGRGLVGRPVGNLGARHFSGAFNYSVTDDITIISLDYYIFSSLFSAHQPGPGLRPVPSRDQSGDCFDNSVMDDSGLECKVE